MVPEVSPSTPLPSVVLFWPSAAVFALFDTAVRAAPPGLVVPMPTVSSRLEIVRISLPLVTSRMLSFPGHCAAVLPVAKISHCLPPDPVVKKSRPVPTLPENGACRNKPS